MVRVTVLVSVTGTTMVEVPETTVLEVTARVVSKGFLKGRVREETYLGTRWW
jgi:hypothetical protein